MNGHKVADCCPYCHRGFLVTHCSSPTCDELTCPACRSAFTADALHTYTPPPKEPAS